MAENKEVKSRREQHIERLRKKYPDKAFEDDEEIYGAISDDYDQYEQELEERRGRENTLSEMFAADPRSAQLLTDMRRGVDPVIGMVRNFGLEVRDVLDDPEMQDKIAEANREHVERVAKSRELDAEYERNFEETLETLRRFQEERGMSDDQVDEVVDFLIGIVNDGVMGKFSSETLGMVCKAINHDSDVANATEEGMVAGRNQRIVENLRKRDKGDGVAPLNGKNNAPSPQREEELDVFAQAALAR